MGRSPDQATCPGRGGLSVSPRRRSELRQAPRLDQINEHVPLVLREHCEVACLADLDFVADDLDVRALRAGYGLGSWNQTGPRRNRRRLSQGNPLIFQMVEGKGFA